MGDNNSFRTKGLDELLTNEDFEDRYADESKVAYQRKYKK